MRTPSWKLSFRLLQSLPPQNAVKHPIMGAPMLGVSGGKLAAATTKAGAVGFIAAGHLLNLDPVQREIEVFRDLVRKADFPAMATPLCLGVIGHSGKHAQNSPAFWKNLERLIVEEKPHALQFFAPAMVLHEEHQSNLHLVKSLSPTTKVFVQVGSIREAKEILTSAADCVDGIIVQGSEAGGHGLRPEQGNSLLPLLTRMYSILHADPLYSHVSLWAAGGIVDARTMAAALMCGADGVVLGTRLWASEEAMGRDSYKQVLVDTESCDDAVRTLIVDAIQNQFVSAPWPEPFDSLGVIKNDLWRETMETASLQQKEHGLAVVTPEVVARYRAGQERGDPSVVPVLAGQGIGEVDAIEPAATLIERISRESLSLIQRSSARWVSDDES